MPRITTGIHLRNATDVVVRSAEPNTIWLGDSSLDWALFIDEVSAASIHQALITRWPHLCQVIKESSK